MGDGDIYGSNLTRGTSRLTKQFAFQEQLSGECHSLRTTKIKQRRRGDLSYRRYNCDAPATFEGWDYFYLIWSWDYFFKKNHR